MIVEIKGNGQNDKKWKEREKQGKKKKINKI